MPFQVSPGVNVSEIDLTTVVPAVSTTEGAIAGAFRWGPADQRVLVDSEDRLVSIFQKPNSNNATDFFTAANFLAYGNALNVVRVVHTDAKNAAGTAGNAALIKNEDSTIPSAETFYAKYAGELGNSLKVSVCAGGRAWESNTNLTYSATRGAPTILVTGDDDITDVLQVGDTIVIGPNNTELTRTVKSFAASGSDTLITLNKPYDAATIAVGESTEKSLNRKWEYYGLFDDAPVTTADALASGGQDDEVHVVVIDAEGAFTGVAGSVLETYSSVSLAVDAKTEQGAGNYWLNVINQQSAYLSIGGAAYNGSGAVKSTNFATETVVVTNVDLAGGTGGGDLTEANKINGYDLFKSAEDVDVSFLLGGSADTTLATHLISNIAESRKDCIVVLSPERADVVNNNSYAGKETEDVIAFRNGLPSSSYAVMDSGWKYQYDKYNDVYRYVPLNADTAGLMVQTDLVRDPWISPAGFNRGNVKNVIKLAYNPSKGDRDALYKKGINPVTTFPGQGTVLFGDKTLLSKPSAFDRINVRRLFIVLEKAISTASKFTLFEFNDDFTRSQFRNLVEPFLRDVQGRRGITDFVVVCDGTNNTGEVVDRNEFIGDIYIKPARSINFIQLNFVAVRSGVEFSEIVGRA
jgi:phage tail sheath protein FI